jgi:hypothetical protein
MWLDRHESVMEEDTIGGRNSLRERSCFLLNVEELEYVGEEYLKLAVLAGVSVVGFSASLAFASADDSIRPGRNA